MTFDDEFNSLNWGTWQAPYSWAPNGYEGPGTTAWLVNPNWGPTSGGNANTFSDSNGVLTLNLFPTPSSVASSVDYAPFLGAQIETHNTFSQEYGYFEMNAKLSGTPGTLSAFWLMPENGSWPPEIDVEEITGGDPTTLVTSSHSASNGTFNPWTDISNASTSFNTYAVDWEPNTITWYFNGKAVASEATPSDMHQPMYMIASLFSGTSGSWEGEPSSGATASMQINYIHVYSSDPYTGSGATQTASISGSTTSSTPAATSTGTTTSSSSTPAATVSTSDTTTISASHTSLTDSSGNHLIFITGSDNTLSLSGGTDTVIDSGAGGNTINLPAAGNGSVGFNWESIAAGDVFNLKTALAATSWDGSASDVGSFLHTTQSNGSTQLLVTSSATSQATGTLLASWNADYSLAQILAHAVT
jgi:beta-glucanase (GH16 family)